MDYVFPTMSYEEFMASAKGPLAIPMTNDYLFRAVLQSNNYALTGLVCSLLHLEPEKVQSVEVTNPIMLGHAVDEKEFFLDVRVEIDKSTVLNLEMQVLNEDNWAERSLSYLCREFDNLSKGADYRNVKSAIQIGLVSFSLFSEDLEFYATYKLMNVKTYKIYSDKLQLSVVDLTHIDLATEEDKYYHIDKWAALFKATSWEEVKMLVQENDFMKEASRSYYQLSQEEEIRLKCEAREDYYRRQRSLQLQFEELKASIEEQKTVLTEQEALLTEQEALLAGQNSTLAEQGIIIAEKEAAIAEKDVAIAEKEATIAEKDVAIAEKDAAIAEKDSVIAQQDSTIAALMAKIARLEAKATASDI